MLLKDEVQKLDEFLFLQVGERLEDALSDLLLQRRRVGHARNYWRFLCYLCSALL